MWLFRKHKEGNDETLAAAYRENGDRQVAGELFERHVKNVYGVCLFYFRDRATAQDAVMGIFEKLLTELRRHHISNFKAWLSFVTRNYCISELRKTKQNRFLPETYLDFELKETSLEEETILSGINDERLLSYLGEMLPQLKEKQRICIELFYLRNRSYLEIEEETGFGLNEVKSYIQNGKRNLKLLIEEKIKRHVA